MKKKKEKKKDGSHLDIIKSANMDPTWTDGSSATMNSPTHHSSISYFKISPLSYLTLLSNIPYLLLSQSFYDKSSLSKMVIVKEQYQKPQIRKPGKHIYRAESKHKL